MYGQDATEAEFRVFVGMCESTRLNPFARQIYLIKRGGKSTVQVSIDGARLVAERSGKYAGQLGPFWTADGKEWVDCWIDKSQPKAAKVAVMRSDFKEPLWAVAIWDAYCAGGPMWTKMGPTMLAKCAEMLALRKGFPQELSGLYSTEEMEQADVTPAEDLPPQDDLIDTGEAEDLSKKIVAAAVDPAKVLSFFKKEAFEHFTKSEYARAIKMLAERGKK